MLRRWNSFQSPKMTFMSALLAFSCSIEWILKAIGTLSMALSIAIIKVYHAFSASFSIADHHACIVCCFKPTLLGLLSLKGSKTNWEPSRTQSPWPSKTGKASPFYPVCTLLAKNRSLTGFKTLTAAVAEANSKAEITSDCKNARSRRSLPRGHELHAKCI